MDPIIIVGGGPAGLTTLSRLYSIKRQNNNNNNIPEVILIDNKSGFKKYKTSHPATFKDIIQNLSSRLGNEEEIVKAIKEGRYDFKSYSHFNDTIEGSKRLESIIKGEKEIKKKYSDTFMNFKEINDWVYNAIVQNGYKEFAFKTQNAEKYFKTTLVKADPIVLERIIATGVEDKIMFGTEAVSFDKNENKKTIKVKNRKEEKEIKYSLLIDGTGSGMFTSPEVKNRVSEKHYCYEYIIRNGKDFPDEMMGKAMFYIDVDKNLNPKDPTNTSCVWIYFIDKRHCIIGPDDYIGGRISEPKDVNRKKVMKIMEERFIQDLNHDPTFNTTFEDYKIIHEVFNEIPQAGKGLKLCKDYIIRVGDSGFNATSAAGEGWRRGIEFGRELAEAIGNKGVENFNSLQKDYMKRVAKLNGHKFFGLYRLNGPRSLYGGVRYVLFNWFNDKTWNRTIKGFDGVDSETMESFLRNSAGVFKLLKGFGKSLSYITRRGFEVRNEPKKVLYSDI
jgi:flavin-dependent dehydrogenase